MTSLLLFGSRGRHASSTTLTLKPISAPWMAVALTQMSKTKPQTKTSVIPSSDSSAVSPVSFAWARVRVRVRFGVRVRGRGRGRGRGSGRGRG